MVLQNNLLKRSSVRGRASAEAALAEKKIAILERALQHHSGSNALLLELLRLVRPTVFQCSGVWGSKVGAAAGASAPGAWPADVLQQAAPHMNTCTSSACARPLLQLRRRIAPCDRQCNAASITTPAPARLCQRTLPLDAALPHCQQASAVGDFDRAADRWRDVLRAYPGRPALWRGYLAFRQTHFASFSARKLRHLHDDAMDVSSALSAVVQMVLHAECCARAAWHGKRCSC